MHDDPIGRMNEEDGFTHGKPFWRCESCGHEDHTKPLPRNREAYYRNPKPGKCPKCKSEDMAPVGF